MINNSICGVLLLLSSSAIAGDSDGVVTELTVNANSEVLVSAGIITNPTECGTLAKFVADLNTEHGRAMYSLLLSAQAQNRTVSIKGTTTCDIRANAESIQYVKTKS